MKYRYPFSLKENNLGEAAWCPYTPINLFSKKSEITIEALLDTGSSVNIIPKSVGEALKLDWNMGKVVHLSGALVNIESKAFLLHGKIEGFEKKLMPFVCTKSDAHPVILGQMNFFLEFDICFFRSELFFEISEKRNNT